MAANPESILDTVKKVVGFDPDYTVFDLDIIMHVNSAFSDLAQIGAGADTGFTISDNTILWSQYASDQALQSLVKNYICLKTRLGFDPPSTSFGIEAIRKLIEEASFRILVAAEHLNPPSSPVLTDEDAGWIPVIVGLTFAPVITPNASAGNVFYLSMDGDCTINAPVAAVDGQHITFDITSNGHAVTWGPGWNFGLLGEPVLTPDGHDVVSGYYRASSTEWVAGFTGGF